MEKRKPHYALSLVKTLIEGGKVRATASAFEGARAIGVHDLDGMCAVVAALTPDCFYKSMTTHADHKIWQDVYHASVADQEVYLKLTIVVDVLIVSFKEL